MNLHEITDPTFLKSMSTDELAALAAEIRSFLISSLSQTGGHLSSNLGVVELTIALHYVFNSPIDKIFFDVGHQSYVHKILTGRASQFPTLRKTNGLSGFQKIAENEHDVWEAGHASTALSAGIAMAVSRDLNKQSYSVIPVIGDAALVGGLSLEALNHLGSLPNKVIIILNDNQMAIGKSIGGVDHFLGDLRLSKTYNQLKEEYRELFAKGKVRGKIFDITKHMKDFVKKGIIKSSLFSEFGLEYLGPIDGHDFRELCNALNLAKDMQESVVVHIKTQKGKGYPYAEVDNTGKWHGITPFDIKTGKAKVPKEVNTISWSSFVASQVEKHMERDDDIVTITPAMIHGSALENIFYEFPKRSFDVGIAEEHALTFAAGLSLQGKKPFISIYSTFLQRAYDELNHDIARMNLPCLICIDRAGLVGADGPTHHGVFDISFLLSIPNVIVFAPSSAYEAGAYIHTAFRNQDHPYIMRVSKSTIEEYPKLVTETLPVGSWVVACNAQNYDATIICYGDAVREVVSYFTSYAYRLRVINARFIKPMDERMLQQLQQDDKPLIIYERDLKLGGLASQIAFYFLQRGNARKIYSLGIGDHYTKQGSIPDLWQEEKIDLRELQRIVEESIGGK